MSGEEEISKVHPKLHELFDEFRQRFYSKYENKIIGNLAALMSEGIMDIIYYEPTWFLLANVKAAVTLESPSRKLIIFATKPFIYRRAFELRYILERECELFGMRKALVFEEHYLFEEFKLEQHPLDPDGMPLTPLEQAVFMEPGFKTMSLTHEDAGLLGGRILTIEDALTLNEKLYKPN
jgi:hypothetical protein